MTASKANTLPASLEGIGRTDLALVDSHQVTEEEYDDLPELTDEMVARSVSGDGSELTRRGRGRPKAENPKQQVTMRLDADLIEVMRASGSGWQGRANDALRARFMTEPTYDEYERLDKASRRKAKIRAAEAAARMGGSFVTLKGQLPTGQYVEMRVHAPNGEILETVRETTTGGLIEDKPRRKSPVKRSA